jgi:hypothetical protein
MSLLVAFGAERNQILGDIVSKLAAKAKVVNLEILQSATMLAPPTIASEYL